MSRGGSGIKELEFTPFKMHANKMDLSFATQLFINGEFVDATSGKKTKLYNPHDESLICEVDVANAADVDKAVRAADKGIFLNFFFSFHLENISEILTDIFLTCFISIYFFIKISPPVSWKLK